MMMMTMMMFSLQEDSDGDGYISCLQVLLALKNIIPPELLSDEEEIYVYRVGPLLHLYTCRYKYTIIHVHIYTHTVTQPVPSEPPTRPIVIKKNVKLFLPSLLDLYLVNTGVLL